VGWTLTFNGNSNITNTCTGSGMTPITVPAAGPVALVE
jgi:hypothetical protein